MELTGRTVNADALGIHLFSGKAVYVEGLLAGWLFHQKVTTLELVLPETITGKVLG